MIIHKAETRGVSTESWLSSHHSFAFNFWYHPDRMGFGKLRVLNDDVIAPNKGFGTHGHANMEIVTIPLKGAVKHQDSAGGSGIIKAGEVQRMSAGKGVYHSEHNASETEPLELLQIWIEPKQNGIPPSYEQTKYKLEKNRLTVLVDGTQDRKVGDALYMHQHARFSLGEFDKGQDISYEPGKGRGAYLFVISGQIKLGSATLIDRDAAGIETPFAIEILADAQLLLIEVPL